MARKYLKKLVLSHNFLYTIYLKYFLSRQKFLLRRKIKSSRLFKKLLSRKEVVRKVIVRKNFKSSEVCHIVGSGWSLNNSLHIIRKRDFVIGFNYAGLADIDFDAYFFEFGGSSVEKISLNHLHIARNIIVPQTDLVFFKNISDKKNDVRFIEDNWLYLASPIKDRQYPLIGKKYLKLIVSRSFDDYSQYTPQLCSSVVTSIILAYQAGFNKIVVHGLDFGGEYFYESFKDRISSMYLPLGEGKSFYGISNKNSVHPTASGSLGMKEIIPVVKDFLDNKGVEILCGCSSSPASEFLPVYGVIK